MMTQFETAKNGEAGEVVIRYRYVPLVRSAWQSFIPITFLASWGGILMELRGKDSGNGADGPFCSRIQSPLHVTASLVLLRASRVRLVQFPSETCTLSAVKLN